MFPAIYTQLFVYVYEEEPDFSADYYLALMENRILRKEAQQFEKETEVWKEALKTLDDEFVSRSTTREEFSVHSCAEVRGTISGRRVSAGVAGNLVSYPARE